MPLIRNFVEAQELLRPFYDNSRTPYTLHTMQALMSYLGNPQNTIKVLHVAGTSGKTSTAYYCAALLRASGQTVGLSVSPHVDTVNERLQVNGEPLPEAEFCSVLGEFMDVVAGSGIKPSYFELLAAMAYWEFARRGLDYAVIEVGLGGLLDGTNAVTTPNKLCIITDIGLDHTEILGDTPAKIAAQKAGIIHDQNHVFMYEQSPEVMEVVEQKVHEQQATLHTLHDEQAISDGQLPLFQQRNLGLAVQAVDYALQRDCHAALQPAALMQAAHVTIPARLERFTVGDKLVIIDGSHNQQKIHALINSINRLYPSQDIAALCGFVQGHDARWQGGITELGQAVKHLIVTSFKAEQDVPKPSVDARAIAEFYENAGYGQAVVVQEPARAYQALLERPEPILLVTGSFYLLNHIRPLVRERV